MSHKNRIARDRLNFLRKQIVDQERLSTSDNAVSDIGLAEYSITRLAHNFETLDDESSNLSQTSLILFVPLPLTKLRAHPIEPESLEVMKFRDYVPMAVLGRGHRIAHVMRPYQVLRKGVLVPILWRRKTWNLFSDLPKPFWFGWGLDGPKWETLSAISPGQVDGQDVYANLTLQTIHSFNGVEDAMHYHELVTIISAMRNRARQFKVDDIDMDDDDEMTELEDTMSEEEWDQYDRVFPKEARFPVLMTSYFGPQHGRVFYACMDGHQLVIHQSKTYTFERFKTVPIELFSRLLLSRPLADSLLRLP